MSMRAGCCARFKQLTPFLTSSTPFFLPLFGSSIGLPSSTSSLMLAGFNLASAFGRIGFGLGADHFLGSVNAFLLCMFSNALSTLVIWPLAGSVSPL